MPYSLRLIEDTLAPGARYSPALGSAAGVLYLAGGEMRVADGACVSSSCGSRPPGRAGACSSSIRWLSILARRGSCAVTAWTSSAVQ